MHGNSPHLFVCMCVHISMQRACHSLPVTVECSSIKTKVLSTATTVPVLPTTVLCSKYAQSNNVLGIINPRAPIGSNWHLLEGCMIS